MKTSEFLILVTTLNLIAGVGCTNSDGTASALSTGGGGPGGGSGQPTGAADASDIRTGPQCRQVGATHAPQATAGLVDEIAPAPPSIGADVPATYFGPSPSSVNPNLVGPLTLLKSGSIDFAKGTIKLPLYKGMVKSTGLDVYYILTDTSDKGIADGLGLNYSAKLKFANAAASAGVNGSNPANTLPARQAHTTADLSLQFDNGTVDFAPRLTVTPGGAPNFFPPSAVQPGSIGDSDYTPLVYVQDQGVVYNAPVVAYGVTDADLSFCDGTPDYAKVHDKVTAICPRDGTVTLRLTAGFSFGKPVWYLSTDASDPLPAAIEQATFAPALQNTRVGGDDGAFSAVERIFSFANGPTNVGTGDVVNPQRQGLNSALKGEGGPLNVLGGIPHVATDYSPLWDFNLGVWTADAIAKGYRSRVNEEFQILGLVQRGFITGPGGKPWGSTGLIVDCPIVHRFL
jgi:hypothetical protein